MASCIEMKGITDVTQGALSFRFSFSTERPNKVAISTNTVPEGKVSQQQIQ